MDDEIFAFAFGALAVSVPALLIAWWLALRRLERFEGREPRRAPPPPDDRFDPLIQRLDDLGSKIEQLAKGQEFLAQVLSRRREGRAAPAQEAVEVTPP